MRKIFLILTGFLLVNCHLLAQDSSYTISGNLEKINAGIIHLTIYKNGQTITDSTRMKNGKFTFIGTVTSPYFATLTMQEKKNDYFAFYIEPGQLQIVGRADSLKLLAVKGSKVNDDDRMLKSSLKSVTAWEATNSKLYETAYKEKNKGVMDSLDEVENEVLMAKRKVIASFIKENPSSLRGAMAIPENFGYYAEASDIQPLYNDLTPSVKNSDKGKEVKKMIDVYSTVAIGKSIPDINQYTTDSALLSITSLRGKYVLVDFWASWCGPCRRENPNIVAAYNQYKDKDFTVFGVSYDTKKNNWIKAINDDHLNWYQVSELDGWKNITSSQFGIKAIPSNMLVDKNGVIIAKNLFGKKLTDKLAEIMQ
ncbi:MAG: TlpA disulfide reductase family protein [Ginsengibacter sp.]